MPLTLRKNKGAPLLIEEVDQNFMYLEERILQLEQDTFVPETFDSFTVKNGQLEITGSSGNKFGPYNLQSHPSVQGMWKSNTNYAKGDLVQHKNTLYIVKNDHLSAEDFTDDNLSICFKSDVTQVTQEKNLFTQENLPESSAGQIVFIATKQGLKPAYHDGKKWFYLIKGTEVEEGEVE